MDTQYRPAKCVLPNTSPIGSLVFTKVPGVRNCVVNYTIQLVEVYCLQRRTKEETIICLYNNECMFV